MFQRLAYILNARMHLRHEFVKMRASLLRGGRAFEEKVHQHGLATADIAEEIDAARRNLLLFRELGVLSANVEAALKEMNQAAPDKPAALPVRVILFTGHMLDAPSRDKDKARFPNTPEAVAAARKMIEKVVKEEMNEDGGVSFGVAGGACGRPAYRPVPVTIAACLSPSR